MFNLYVTANKLIIWRTGGTGNEIIQSQELIQNKTRTWKWENSPKGHVKVENTTILFVCPFALYKSIFT